MVSPIAVIYDPATLVVTMVVVPDQNDPRNEKQLDDPAWNPKGLTHARIDKAHYDAKNLTEIAKLVPAEVMHQTLSIKSAADLGLVQGNPGRETRTADEIAHDADIKNAYAKTLDPTAFISKLLVDKLALADVIAQVGEKAQSADAAVTP